MASVICAAPRLRYPVHPKQPFAPHCSPVAPRA